MFVRQDLSEEGWLPSEVVLGALTEFTPKSFFFSLTSVFPAVYVSIFVQKGRLKSVKHNFSWPKHLHSIGIPPYLLL